MSRQTPLDFGQIHWRAEWGNWYFATDDGPSSTHQSGVDGEVRRGFRVGGRLNNSQDTRFRAISEDQAVFALSKHLGNVSTEPVSTLFTIGVAQSSSGQYMRNSGLEVLPSLWASYFSDDLDAVSAFA